jgi:hypothetical protein
VQLRAARRPDPSEWSIVGTEPPSPVAFDADAARSFRETGVALLAGAFDPDALAAEMDDAFGEVFDAATSQHGSGGIRFASVPMMTERTPASVLLADALAKAAAAALGRPVLPGRAKGTRYTGESALHVDSELDIPSLGCVAYLEPLRRGQGAFEVQLRGRPEPVALETQPGDIVVFDEHLDHGSRGGGVRRQWRVDYIADPRTDQETELVRRSFAQIFDVRWEAGYDVERFPSFGEWWRHDHPQWSTRLEELGVIDMARAWEAAMSDAAS